MRVKLLAEAREDLHAGFQFYEKQQAGLGRYFVSCLQADIDSLRHFSGIHPKYRQFYRLLSRRFPYAVYYQVRGETAEVYAVLDCRINPGKTYERLI